MKDFQLAAEEAEQQFADGEEPDKIQFTIGGKGPYEFYVPSSDQLALYSAAFGQDAEEGDLMTATMDFIRAVFVPDSYKEIRKRLNDRKDLLTMEVLVQVVEYIFEEYTGRPTKPLSASSSSRESGGKTLTDHLPPQASTRSRSPRAGS